MKLSEILMNAPKALVASMVALGMTLGIVTFVSAPVSAVDTTAACQGVEAAGGDCNSDGEGDVTGVIETVVDILSVIVGAVSVIMIIIGGLRYITSAGDSSGITAAKNTILYAIVGLVVVIFAQAIVAFVISRLN